MALNNCQLTSIYHTSPEQKRLSKNAARQYKYGSPKLRDLLREKCRIRIKEARTNNFDGTRNVQNSLLLGRILREEVAQLEEDIELQNLIYQEILEEAYEWIFEENELNENYIITTVNENDYDHIFCPICQISPLRLDSIKGVNEFNCDCGIRFHFSGSLEDFSRIVCSHVTKHGNECNNRLTFFVEPTSLNGNILNALCPDCDYCFELR